MHLNGERISVLLVEDNPGDALLIREELDLEALELQTQVEVVDRLAAARELVPKKHFDVVLVDLGLPDSSGLETVEEMVAAADGVPVIVLTGDASAEVGLQSIQVGAQDFLSKSDARDAKLVRTVRYAIERRQAQLRAQRSESILGATLDALTANVAILDQQGNILRVNRAWRQFGEARGARMVTILPGANYLEACAKGAEEEAHYVGDLRRLLAGELQTIQFEYPCHSPTERMWCLCVGHRFHDGTEPRVVLLHLDITERKQASLRLKAQHEELQNLQRIAHLGGWELDLRDMSLEWTDETFRIFGISREEFGGTFEAFAEFIHRDDRQRATTTQGRVHTGSASALEHEYRIVRPDWEIRHLYEQGDVELDPQGRPSALRGSVIDVTPLKRAEQSAREMADRLDGFFEHSPLILAEVSLDYRYEVVNSRFCELLGRPRSEVRGRTLEELLPPAMVPDFKARIDEVVATRQTTVVEDLVDIGDEQAIFSTWLFPLFDQQDRVRSVGSIGQDITQQRRHERERVELTEQLRQSQKLDAIGRLAGGVAHDFNNMLSVILGYTDMVMESLGEEHPAYEDLQAVESAAERSTNLTRQLLAFARQQTIAPEVVDLNREIPRMLRMLERLVGENVEILWRPDDDLWPVLIDPSQIDQILANLAVNARDAIDDVGRLVIETANQTFDEQSDAIQHPFRPGDFVVLRVSDTGSGMTAEIREKIFEPFFTTKTASRGTGLGLATVYGIVQQNEGFIQVHSEAGRGTEFAIYLPRATSVDPARSSTPTVAEAPTGDERVVLVEDEVTLLELTRRQLESLGYEVLGTSSPEEALALFEADEGPIHLLVTDVIMPGMNGRQLHEEVKKLRPDTPALFLSGYSTDVIAHHGVLDPGVNFLSKPVSKTALGEKIRSILDRD